MNNQKGMSLVELLAVIAILFIISGIIYGVFFTFNNNYDRISHKSSMDQTANLVLATIKQYHQTNDAYWIKYDDSGKKAYIGKDTANHLLGDSLYDMEIKVGYPTTTAISNLKIDSQQPLSVLLTLTDQKGQKYEVETTVKRY
ncbi:prepilin-type N-terminal cleavage/methylation domain-containing protein [Bacillus sp. ISL-37]|jgi:prepilin-type N-terminal cleavage/methylation domain-containing protein|uniref:PilW family protein n=1 Tax=Bacillus sp. ISL-37 TaxID=2819123 RepID=UPI001BE9EBF6|nr:prepilin-type N-terminal cleavage/methylation domain-containing protein [Bacillus sp. ISL-37]MBT2684576.1 prepilin-type N-terminal cleavage/methylation domain-containing protein [Bacillus sp. ISL-37]